MKMVTIMAVVLAWLFCAVPGMATEGRSDSAAEETLTEIRLDSHSILHRSFCSRQGIADFVYAEKSGLVAKPSSPTLLMLSYVGAKAPEKTLLYVTCNDASRQKTIVIPTDSSGDREVVPKEIAVGPDGIGWPVTKKIIKADINSKMYMPVCSKSSLFDFVYSKDSGLLVERTGFHDQLMVSYQDTKSPEETLLFVACRDGIEEVTVIPIDDSKNIGIATKDTVTDSVVVDVAQPDNIPSTSSKVQWVQTAYLLMNLGHGLPPFEFQCDLGEKAADIIFNKESHLRVKQNGAKIQLSVEPGNVLKTTSFFVVCGESLSRFIVDPVMGTAEQENMRKHFGDWGFLKKRMPVLAIDGKHSANISTSEINAFQCASGLKKVSTTGSWFVETRGNTAFIKYKYPVEKVTAVQPLTVECESDAMQFDLLPTQTYGQQYLIQ